MKKYSSVLLAFLLCIVCALPVSATDQVHPPRVVDEADLLTTEEEIRLENELNEISERQQFDVVVVTVDSTNGADAEDFADDYFDYNGYGMGENFDGALFLVNMEYREWHISTCGYGITALHDQNLMYMEEEIIPYLSDGAYYEAFHTFGEMCDQMVSGAEPVSGGASFVDAIMALPVCILVGFLLAGIPLWNLKRQMKSVNARSEASDYIKRDKTVITRSRDAFLYRNVARQRKPKENTSTMHRSSSGRSHGGRGGSF